MRKKYTTRYGVCGEKLHGIWDAMKARCYNPNVDRYSRYGGRGIRVCDRWNNSYLLFKQDMSPGYGQGMTIDRIDNDGDYCPENCRWITKKENGRKTSLTKLSMELAQEIRKIRANTKMTHRELADKFGVCKATISKTLSGEYWS